MYGEREEGEAVSTSFHLLNQRISAFSGEVQFSSDSRMTSTRTPYMLTMLKYSLLPLLKMFCFCICLFVCLFVSLITHKVLNKGLGRRGSGRKRIHFGVFSYVCQFLQS